MQKVPSFFLIGAPKCGTTSLHYYLSQHPDVLMSDPKEPFFFRMEFERGLDDYVRAYFRRYAGQKVLGDAAPQHLFLPYVARRIEASVRRPRFAVICRNPVERILSQYWAMTSSGVESRPFEEVLEINLERLARGPRFETESESRLLAEVFRKYGMPGVARTFSFYLEPGHYAHFINLYRSIFGEDRVMVLFLEDLRRDPQGTTNELFRFLDLDPIALTDTRALNQARSVAANRTVQLIGELPGVDRLPFQMRNFVKRRIVGVLKGGKPTRAPIGDATRRYLVQHYRPHNLRLAQMTRRSLDHWNTAPP